MKECTKCGSTEKYYAKGLCKICYGREFWANKYKGNEKIKAQAKLRSDKHYVENKEEIMKKRAIRKSQDPDGWREYFREAQKKFRKRLEESGTNDRELYLYGGIKKLVYERDKYSCCDCGVTQEEYTKRGHGQLHVHHIDNKGYYKPSKEKNNNIDNLVTLCNVCHSKETQRILYGHKPRTLEEFKN